MQFIFFLIAIGMIVLKVMNRISWSWVTVGLISVALLLLPGLLNGNIFGTLFKSTNSNTNDPLLVDACGCGPTQVVGMSRRNWLGKYKDAGTAPCNVALSRVAGGRYRINGCVN